MNWKKKERAHKKSPQLFQKNKINVHKMEQDTNEGKSFSKFLVIKVNLWSEEICEEDIQKNSVTIMN